MKSAMPVPRGSTATIRSRRLSVRRPSPTTPCLGRRRADHPERFLRHRAIRVEVIGSVEIDGIELTPWHKLRQVDDLRAFDVECLQFLGGKRDELTATVFIALDDLRLINLLTRSRIMRPDSDPGGRAGLICVIAASMSTKVRHQRLGKLGLAPRLLLAISVTRVSLKSAELLYGPSELALDR